MTQNKKPNKKEIVCAHGYVNKEEMNECRKLFGKLLADNELCIACDVLTKIKNERS